MSNDNFRGWIEILSNLGVLIGIVFLVYELNQNSVSQRMEAKLALSERFAEFDGSLAENSDLAQLVAKADFEGADLTPLEWSRYRAHYNRWMSILMRVQALHDDGVFNDADWREYVCEPSRFYSMSAAFRRFVDGVRQDYLSQKIYDALRTQSACGS